MSDLYRTILSGRPDSVILQMFRDDAARGLAIDPRVFERSNYVSTHRAQPAVEHRANFETLVAAFCDEIDPERLPRINIMAPEISSFTCAFLWGPQGEWTGFVRAESLFKPSERDLRYSALRHGNYYSLGEEFRYRADSQWGRFEFVAWPIVKSPGRFQDQPEVYTVLRFASYEDQAAYAATVEETR